MRTSYFFIPRGHRTVYNDVELVLRRLVHVFSSPKALVDILEHGPQNERREPTTQKIRRGEERDDAQDDERGDDRACLADLVAEPTLAVGPVHEVAARARVAHRALVSGVAVIGARAGAAAARALAEEALEYSVRLRVCTPVTRFHRHCGEGGTRL